MVYAAYGLSTRGYSAWRKAFMPAGDSGWAGAEARPRIRTPCHPIVRHYYADPHSVEIASGKAYDTHP